MRLKDGITRPASATIMDNFEIEPRNPPIRVRKNIPDTWIEITLREGKNRQARRMCAHIGFPVLRLIRAKIDSYSIEGLAVGESHTIQL
jgi:23S rRNA pseudouridine2457 synthase